jgi:ACS family hexuronate transporter-like MFS transporter
VITPIIITPIAAMWGWRGAFWATGAVGAMWLLLWLSLSRRIDVVRTEVRSDSPKFNDPRVWAFIAAYAMGAFPSAFVLYQAAVYLAAVFGKSQVEIGKVLWIPPLGWEIGYFFWGWAMDRFPHAMRRQFFWLMVLSTPLAAIPYAAYRPALLLMFFAMFITSGFIIGAVAYATRHFSSGHAGFIAGLGAGSWSLVVALVMPGVGRLFDLHRYGTAFLIAALFPVAGCAVWTMLSRRCE